MSVAYQSVQSTNFATSTTVTITKPVSLAVGDMMLAHIVYGRTRTLTPFTGWKNLAGTVDQATTLDEGAASNCKASVQWRIADSADVAASNFTWTISGSDTIGGSIFRITGQNTSPIGASSSVVTLNSATPSFTGITPLSADSLLLMLGSTGNGTAGSGYAVATSDPTWTERYDNASGASYLRVGATASRPQVTATGNGTWTIASGDATSDSTAFLIAIDPLASGPANLKSFDTNLKANIKSINTNLLANIKSLNTNT